MKLLGGYLAYRWGRWENGRLTVRVPHWTMLFGAARVRALGAHIERALEGGFVLHMARANANYHASILAFQGDYHAPPHRPPAAQ